MRTPITYYGGKQMMLPHIMPLIPEHNVYVEPFAGGAAVLFAKEPVQTNVINDLNGELINFYRTCVSDFPALRSEILKTLHCREQHQIAWAIYNNPDYFDNVKRAWATWALSVCGFSGMLSTSFGISRTGAQKSTKIAGCKMRFTEELRELLEKCTIEQDNALAVISRFDCSNAFHFIDPPYVGSNMGHYTGMFTREDLKQLLDLCADLRGKFMLTMYPDEMIEQYAEHNNWIIHRVERTVTAAKIKRRKQEEWMICNYEI